MGRRHRLYILLHTSKCVSLKYQLQAATQVQMLRQLAGKHEPEFTGRTSATSASVDAVGVEVAGADAVEDAGNAADDEDDASDEDDNAEDDSGTGGKKVTDTAGTKLAVVIPEPV